MPLESFITLEPYSLREGDAIRQTQSGEGPLGRGRRGGAAPAVPAHTGCGCRGSSPQLRETPACFVPVGFSHSARTSQPPVFWGRRQEDHPRACEEDRDVVMGPADGRDQVAGSSDRVCGSREEADVDCAFRSRTRSRPLPGIPTQRWVSRHTEAQDTSKNHGSWT